MNYNNKLIVGGTFDEYSGKKSGLIDKLFKNKLNENDLFINGGNIKEIQNILNIVPNYKIIIWCYQKRK